MTIDGSIWKLLEPTWGLGMIDRGYFALALTVWVTLGLLESGRKEKRWKWRVSENVLIKRVLLPREIRVVELMVS